ncbi:hypothetical protein J6590_021407 [Homalodisca vitripennis]|nr:hypothetical protein J6590_021407 [Homalodisca vitripennis]
MEGRPRQSPACLEKCASHRPPEQEEKGSGALARVPRGRHYPYGLESKTAPEGRLTIGKILNCQARVPPQSSHTPDSLPGMTLMTQARGQERVVVSCCSSTETPRVTLRWDESLCLRCMVCHISLELVRGEFATKKRLQ